MTELLYRHNGSIPAALPFEAFDAKGDHWTDLANSPEGRTACGYVLGPSRPAYDAVAQDVRWDGGREAWVVEDRPPPPPPSLDDLYAYASNARYEREIGGMMLDGMPVATDDRSKLLLAGARIKAEADPSYTTRWKVSNTDRVDIPAAQIVAMSDAVLAWVDRTFDAYDKVADLIAAGTARTPVQIDAAFAAELA